MSNKSPLSNPDVSGNNSLPPQGEGQDGGRSPVLPDNALRESQIEKSNSLPPQGEGQDGGRPPVSPDNALRESQIGGRPLGLPDNSFSQKKPLKGLITKAEVRAVSLYYLGLRRDSVVWDIGAGTGSVALEAALIAHDGMVYAIERDTESLGFMQDNIQNLGPQNVQVVPGEAPDAFDGLPNPDSVFVGGSGGKLKAILDCSIRRLATEGRIVVNLAAIERANEAYHHLKALGLHTELTTISASRGKELPDGSTRLEALNPVFIVVGIKEAS